MQQHIFCNMDGMSFNSFLDAFVDMFNEEERLTGGILNFDFYRWVIGERVFFELKESIRKQCGLEEVEHVVEGGELLGIEFKVSNCIDPDSVQLDKKPPHVYISTGGRGPGKTLFDNLMKTDINTIYPSVDKALQNLKKGINKIYSSDKEDIMTYEIKDVIFYYKIKDVIFSGPCTIVLWKDGTKTIVRCKDEFFDREKGLAMAICKKVLGTNNSGSNYYDIFKKWCSEEEIDQDKITHYITVKEFSKTAGVSESTIRKRLRAGQFPGAIKQSGAWLIPCNCGLKSL